MAVDIRFYNLFKNASAIVDEDQLIFLEHGSTRDRVKRVQFDRVESVTTWRKLAWIPMLLWTLAFGIPAGFLLASDEPDTNGIGAAFLVILLAIILIYFVRLKTYLRVIRGGTKYEYMGMMRQKTMVKFLDKLSTAISRSQLAGHEALERQHAQAATAAEQAYAASVEEGAGVTVDEVEPIEQIDLEPAPTESVSDEPETPPATDQTGSTNWLNTEAPEMPGQDADETNRERDPWA